MLSAIAIEIPAIASYIAAFENVACIFLAIGSAALAAIIIRDNYRAEMLSEEA